MSRSAATPRHQEGPLPPGNGPSSSSTPRSVATAATGSHGELLESIPRVAAKKTPPSTPKRRKRQKDNSNDAAAPSGSGSARRTVSSVDKTTRKSDSLSRTAEFGQEGCRATPAYGLEALLQRWLQLATSPFALPLTAAACVAVLCVAAHYWVSQVLSSVSLMPYLPNLGLLSSAPYLALVSPTSLYCNSIGWGCQPRRPPSGDLARLARSVSEQATHAHDIFQSISALGDPALVPSLHFVELWELAIAVSASSKLPSKDVLGDTLKELGDMTRDMSDRLVGINAQGVNSFSWTVREFKRIQKTIQRIHDREAHYATEDVSRQLDDLFTRMTKNLDGLLSSIQDTLPLASRASHLGGDVLLDLNVERARLVESKEQTPLWWALVEAHTFKGKQLQRDLSLAEVSIGGLQDARSQLEEMRKFLLRYRENVAYFKAGLVGFHLSDHQLSPEHEVEALAEIVADFAQAVDQVKQGKSISGKAESSSAET